MTFTFSDPTGQAVALCVFAFITGTIGYGFGSLLLGILRRRGNGTVTRAQRSVAIVSGSAVALTLVGLVYAQILSGFHVLEVDDDSVRVRYALPPHEESLPLDAIASVERVPGVRTNEVLVIRARDGRTLTSAAQLPRNVRAAQERLQAALAR